MTVIAAVSLFDGVMLIADSRVTVAPMGQRAYHCDIAQKIFPLNANMALAFSGDVRAAAMLVPRLIHHMKRRRRLHTLSLLQWFPRFLRETYRQMLAKPMNSMPYGEIQFIIAAIIPDRTNVVERARVADILRKAVSPDASMRRNWMPDVVMRVLMTPAEMTQVPVSGAPAVVLGVMRSPVFALERFAPLSCVAVGSGHGAVVEMERAADWLFANDADIGVKMGLEAAVQDFVTQNDVDSVGGMYPCVKIDRRGLAFLGGTHRFPLYELSLTVEPKTNRWIQENRTTGKKQPLLWPWEIVKSVPSADRRFDDYRQAAEHFNPRRGKRQ